MSESFLRGGIFLSGLVLFSSLEYFIPYRERLFKRSQRWPGNLLLIFISNVLLTGLAPLSLLSFSRLAEEGSVGLLNNVEMHYPLEFIFALVALDFAVYLQHVLSHRVPLLWRFHRVHHSDADLDATSALRFHPVEIIFSIIYKGGGVVLLGASFEAVFVFEVILNFTAMFNHSNIYIPQRVESQLRNFIVTPQMHIIHHSTLSKFSNTNYGFNLSIWDKFFRSYQGDVGGEFTIGQLDCQDVQSHKLKTLLLLPFKKN